MRSAHFAGFRTEIRRANTHRVMRKALPRAHSVDGEERNSFEHSRNTGWEGESIFISRRIAILQIAAQFAYALRERNAGKYLNEKP